MLLPGAEPDIFIWGGLLEGPVLQQGELSMVCVGLSERDLKNFGGVTGGPGKIFGGWVAPPGTPLAPPLAVTELKNVAVKLRVLGSDIHEMGTLDLAWYFEIFFRLMLTETITEFFASDSSISQGTRITQ